MMYVFMKNSALFAFLTFAVLYTTGCKKNPYSVDGYFETVATRDSLVADLITYVYLRPQKADQQTRFNSEFRSFYVGQIPRFKLDRYFIDSGGNHYFLLSRPARSTAGGRRAVGGKFSRDEDRIEQFREVFVTAAGDEEPVLEKGRELFGEMVRGGNVDRYMQHRHYIEWPDPVTKYYYDTAVFEWTYQPDYPDKQ